MGTIYCNEARTRGDIVRIINAEIGQALVAGRTVGNHYYTVTRRPSIPAYVTLWLLSRRDGAWGFKDVDETAYPYHFDCPVALFSLADPPTTPRAAEWRAACVKTAARTRAVRRLVRKLKRGDVVKLSGCCVPELEVVRLEPLLGKHDGALYRIPRRAIVPPEES
jgi:hypothetical protein